MSTGVDLRGFIYRDHPVALITLEPGDTFRLHWEGGLHPAGAAGVLLSINEMRAHVRIRMGEKREQVFRDNKTQKIREFMAQRAEDTDWSPGTLVYKTGTDEAVRETWLRKRATPGGGRVSENSDQGPEKFAHSVSFHPGSFESEEQQAAKAANKKEDKMAKTNGAAKAAPKAARAPKAPVETKPCLCGCGEDVTRRFRPGHDARMFGWFKKVVDGKMEFKDLPKQVQLRVRDKAGIKKELAAH